MDTSEEAIEQLATIMPVAVRTLTDQMAVAIEETGLGITLSQLVLLEMLAKNADPIQCVIAEKMGINKSAILRQVDILEDKGWVERCIDETDRRRKHLVVSKFGELVLRKAVEKRNTEFAKMAAGITEEELRVCSKVLSQLGCMQSQGKCVNG